MEKSLKTAGLARFGEDEAGRFLRNQGYRILERNFRTAKGEIDIIAGSGKMIVFAEVKTRSSANFAQPWEAVGFRKRKHLREAAKIYIEQNGIHEFEFRFDVLSIVVNETQQPEIEWIQNAF